MSQIDRTSKQIQEQIDELILESKTNHEFDKHRLIGALMVNKEKQFKVEKILKREVKVPEDIKNARKQLIAVLRNHQNLLNGQDVQSCFLIIHGQNILVEDLFDKERYEGESFDMNHGVAYWEEN